MRGGVVSLRVPLTRHPTVRSIPSIPAMHLPFGTGLAVQGFALGSECLGLFNLSDIVAFTLR